MTFLVCDLKLDILFFKLSADALFRSIRSATSATLILCQFIITSQ